MTPKSLRRWVAPLRRPRSTRARVLAVSGAFALLIGTAMLAKETVWFGRDTNPLSAARATTVGLFGASGLPGDDPVMRFRETHIGQVVFSSGNERCRRVLFDNSSGSSFEVKTMDCGPSADPAAAVSGPDRLRALRKSFQK